MIRTTHKLGMAGRQAGRQTSRQIIDTGGVGGQAVSRFAVPIPGRCSMPLNLREGRREGPANRIIDKGDTATKTIQHT